jgi:hypothetical protein
MFVTGRKINLLYLILIILKKLISVKYFVIIFIFLIVLFLGVVAI